MPNPKSKSATYRASLRAAFQAYRLSRFADKDHWFEQRPTGGAVVFDRDHVDANLLIPPTASAQDRQRIIDLIAPARRHRHFRSMQSSQALAQSVFGTIVVLNRLPLMSNVIAEDGRAAFCLDLHESKLELEKDIQTLGEPRSTSVDVWVDGRYRVAIECKLSELEFGTCSRPRLKPESHSYAMQYCDGTYTRQKGRTPRCSLTAIKVHYWDHIPEIFGWSSDTDHRPCPLASTYQLVRNVLAVCADAGGHVDVQGGHALIIYDARNPTMCPGGEGDRQWYTASSALRVPSLLRRLSWQDFIAQWPDDSILNWLKRELCAKYGFRNVASAAS